MDTRPYRNLRFQGRLGNQLFQYCTARSHCERNHLELRVEPWLGQLAFDLHDPPITDASEPTDFTGYAQTQDSLTYTATQARSWLPFHPRALNLLHAAIKLHHTPHAHLRRGDYQHLPYVVVSEESYRRAACEHGYPNFYPVTEEFPTIVPNLPPWLPDFYRLAQAPVLFRANSTFSWWAAVLGNPTKLVFSPVIDNLEPGVRDCQFVPGNHPRFHSRGTVTDLHLAP